MAETINIRVYSSSGGIDSTLHPIVDIFEQPGDTHVVNDGDFVYSSTLGMYQYEFLTRDDNKEYVCNIDFGLGALTRFATIQLEKVIVSGTSSGGGNGFYISGGKVDTTGIEKKFTDIMVEIKKEPDKYTKALQTTQKAIIDTVKKMPVPLVNITPPDVKIEVPPDFLQEIKTIVQDFSDGSADRVKATEEAYTEILKRFRENIYEEIKKIETIDKKTFDEIIESSIMKASVQFTQALTQVIITEEDV